MRVLQVRLDFPSLVAKAVAAFQEGLPAVGVVAGQGGVAEAGECNTPFEIDVVPGMRIAGAQTETSPGLAAVETQVPAVGVPGGPALAHVEVGATGAAERADLPAAFEAVVDANQRRGAVETRARRVAVALDPATLAIDLDPGAGVGALATLGGEQRLAVGGTAQRRVAHHPAAVDQHRLHTGVCITRQLVDGVHG